MTELIELTNAQINALPIHLRPGSEGDDSTGPYKIDEFGIKKRPFEKGGPSPNPAGAKGSLRKINTPISVILAENNWMDPAEFFLAIMNADCAFLNKSSKGRGSKIVASDISLTDRISAASKAIGYCRKGADKLDEFATISPGNDPKNELIEESVPTLSLPANGRTIIPDPE